MHDLARLGIRFDCVTWQLQNEGIQTFMDAFDALMHMLEVKGKEKTIVYE